MQPSMRLVRRLIFPCMGLGPSWTELYSGLVGDAGVRSNGRGMSGYVPTSVSSWLELADRFPAIDSGPVRCSSDVAPWMIIV